MSVKIGLFADLHVSQPNAKPRFNSFRCFEDMKKGLIRFEDNHVDFAVSLGDCLHTSVTPQEQMELFQQITSEWNAQKYPVHCVYGNHEFEQMELEKVREILNRREDYYAFDVNGVRFLVLDSQTNPNGTHFSGNNYDWRKTVIDDKQVKWIEERLKDGKRTFVFIHTNLDYEDPNEEYFEWYVVQNRQAVLDLFARYGNVEAVFQGHRHEFLSLVRNGVAFINVPSPMMHDAYSDDCFPIVEIDDNGFTYNGIRY